MIVEKEVGGRDSALDGEGGATPGGGAFGSQRSSMMASGDDASRSNLNARSARRKKERAEESESYSNGYRSG